MPFTIASLDDIPPPQRRVFEHVERLLDGHDAGLVATIALTILTHAIIDMSKSRNLAEIDATIDGVAASLKDGARALIERPVPRKA